MATTTSPCGDTVIQQGPANPLALPTPATANVSNFLGAQGYLASPASTESLLSRMQNGNPYSTLLNSPDSIADSPQASPIPHNHPPEMVQLLSSFSDMLVAGLAQNTMQITSSIKADLQSLGARMHAIEQAVDESAACTTQNATCIHSLQDQLENALSKIEDLENRSRRYNFHVRGIPEANTDISDTIKSLIKEIIPDIPDHKLELDRAHRVLQPPRQDGLPQVIVVKPHFYGVKEDIMKRSHFKDDITLFGLCRLEIQRPSSACHLDLVSAFDDYEYVQDGDIIIGGVFTVNHFMTALMTSGEYVKTMMTCLRPFPPYYRYFLTILYAIDEINKDPTILPNVTLGYHMYDSCNDKRKAVKSILQILSGPGQTVPNYSCRKHGNLAGFIGDQNSATTVNIAEILALYRYTQVSYGATTDVLSNRNFYPTFFRTVQSNQAIFFILSGLLQFFGWTWVGVISSDDDSGNQEIQLLTQYLTMKSICVAYMIKIKLEAMSVSDEIFKNSIGIISKSSAQVIILCGTFSSFMADLLIEVRHVLSNKTFIFGPIFASKTFLMEHYSKALDGSLAVEFDELHVPDMKSFYHSFQVVNHPQDTLLEHIWLLHLHCSGTNESRNRFYSTIYKFPLRNCSKAKRVTEFISFNSMGLTDRVYRAVYSLAHALNNMYLSIGSQNQDKITQVHNYPHQLHYWVKNLRSLKGSLLFHENGELIETFNIVNWKILNNSTLMVKRVGKTFMANGSWQNFFIQAEKILWKSGINKIPKSQCSRNCLPGTSKVQRSGIHSCCYDCVLCAEGEISTVSDSESCQQCRYDEWPNEKKDRCVLKRLDFLSYSDDLIGMVFASSSSILCALTGLILLVFISHQDTPIVKANNRNLSFTLLVSIMLSFLCVFFFLGCPADISCLLRQTSFGIVFTIAISSILAKTIMVYVVFKASKPGSLWQHWIGTRLPNSIVILCSSIQVLICVIWLSISPPFQDLDTSSYQEKMIVQCNEGSVIGFYSVLGYMGFLAVVSFVLAFMVRTLPDSFNEAKYITFSMLVFCSVWIAMIPAYLSTRGKYMVAVEIFAILSSSAGILGCIFLPKCYIILWRPELNIKSYLLEKRSQ
ncbi:vomeronasal type-2 receptor 26-like [Aquarana catesbeiana]|uniref:vomeronasal type-2 receptor 26-like n=1 Tax=Aquarana catesbeiana TaxID=8400 RepID=UPI003CC9E45B